MKVAFILLLLFSSLAVLGETYMRPSSFAFYDGASHADGASPLDKLRLNRKLLEEEAAVLEDYGLIDPAPATKTSVGPRPIDHGTPLIPYLPQQPPPTPPLPS
ncbi:hypothetical protein MLD38_034490 [Melastoma candidum]|uniref:Uncharacterized protein n=1 Tax=Melastoma candidum TaxID=119954 RepID=A0ACB9MCM3_9MYRT|nr:hypothetical protein MLD38_034490 [Melastoma candidum]